MWVFIDDLAGISRIADFFFRDSPLTLADLDVPLAPDLGGSEHATRSAHVTEGGLTGTVSTTTGDTGDTGNGTT